MTGALAVLVGVVVLFGGGYLSAWASDTLWTKIAASRGYAAWLRQRERITNRVGFKL